jgi:hypothetical protein
MIPGGEIHMYYNLDVQIAWTDEEDYEQGWCLSVAAVWPYCCGQFQPVLQSELLGVIRQLCTASRWRTSVIEGEESAEIILFSGFLSIQ